MSIEKNVQIVTNLLAALSRRDKQGLLALSAEDIEWIIPAKTGRWPARTAGTRDWRVYLRRLTKRWKLRIPDPAGKDGSS